MAKNKDKIKVNNFDFDNELNFDDIDIGAIDAQINPDVKKKGKRKVISEVYKGTISGASSKFKDPGFLQSLARKALPDTYGEISDNLGKVTKKATALYDEAVRELKPQLNELARKTDRLVPDSKKKTKKVTSTLVKLLGGSGESPKFSKEQADDQNILLGLQAIFSDQTAQRDKSDAVRDANNQIVDNIRRKEFQTSLGVLTQINDSVGKLASYNEKVNTAVQKKSLEIQYRTLFALRDLTEISRQYFEISKAQGEAITRNTSLPDYVKIKNSERFKDLTRNKFIDKIQNSFFGEGSAIDRGVKRMTLDVRDYIAGMKQGLESATFGVDSYQQMKEMNDQMREMGMEGITPAHLAGNALGGVLASKIGSKVASKIRKYTNKHEALNRALYKGANGLGNLPGSISELRKSDKFRKMKLDEGLKGTLASAGDSFLSYFTDTKPDTRIGNPFGQLGKGQPAVFNDKTQRSIVDVIPGYLARILREITVMSTGDKNAEFLYFDHSNGKFVNKKNLSSSIKSSLTKSIQQTGFGFVAQRAGRDFVDGSDVDEKTQDRITDFLAKISTISNMAFTPENIYQTSAFKELPREAKELVRTILSRKVTNAQMPEKGQYELTKNIMSIRESTPDVRGAIETLINNGYGEILEDQGLVKRNEGGDYEIDEKKYLKMVRDVGLIKSDETKKEDIHPLSPRRALNAIRKIGVYNWKYKKGEGDRARKNGPMAQDVNRYMGDEAAPGGKKIDLTTMNGNNMAAIQELADRQDELEGKGQKGGYLGMIARDTSIIRKLLLSGKAGAGGIGGRASGSFDSYENIIGTILSSSGSLLSKSVRDVFEASKAGFNKAAKLGKDVHDRYKDPVVDGFKQLMGAAGKAAAKALEVGKDVVFNQIPAGVREAMALGQRVKDQLKVWLNQAKDVYVAGQLEPVLKATLIRAGYYRDSVTGKVIESMDDLANLKGNVINKAGEVVLSIHDAANGLYDNQGKVIRTTMGKIYDKMMEYGVKGFNQAKQFGQYALMKGADLLGNFSDKAKAYAGKMKGNFSGFKGMGIGFGDERIYQVLVEIRGILRNEDTPRHEDVLKKNGGSSSGGSSSLKSRVQDFFRGSSSASDNRNTVGTSSVEQPTNEARYASGGAGLGIGIGGLLSIGKRIPGMASGAINAFRNLKGVKGFKGKAASLFGSLFRKKEGEQNTEQNPENFVGPQQPQSPSRMQQFGSMLGNLWKRHGAGAIPAMARKFNDPDGTGRRKGSWEDRLDRQAEEDAARRTNQPGLSAPELKYNNGGNIFGDLKNKAASIMSGAGEILSAAKDVLGIGLSGGKLLGKLGGGLGKLIGLGAKGLGAVARPVIGALGGIGGAIQGATGLGRLAGFAGAVRNVVTVGSLATGGASSVIFGALSTGLSAVGAVISSPVVLGAIAVAAAGYGIYRLYKWAVRDNVDDYEDIRMKQYGIGTGASTKQYNHFMLVLEEYLQDGRVGYNAGKAYILDRKTDPKDLLEIFGVDKEDTETANKFSQWFENRFKPFFLTHMTALYAVDKKSKLKDVSSLDPKKKIEYLKNISFESGPYAYSVSPFKELDKLNTDPKFALNAIELLLRKITKEAKIDTSKDKAPIIPPVNSEKPKTAKKDDDKPATKPNLEPNKEKNLAVSFPKGEDGPLKETGSTGGGSSISLGTAGKLRLADGPVRDGSGGMQYLKLAPGVKIDTMNPSMLKNLLGMAQEYGEKTGKAITITSGTRTTAEQEELFRKDPKKAARPGTSMHEFGLAVDISSGDLDILDDMGLMRKYGFTRPVGGEPWHVEAAGLQVNIPLAKKDPDFASSAIESSLFKGGSGVGSMRGSPLGKRDSATALALLDGSSTSVKDKVNQIADGTLTPAKTPLQTAANDSSASSKPTLTANNTKTNTKIPTSIQSMYSDANKYSASNNVPDRESTNFSKANSSDFYTSSDNTPNGDIKERITQIAKKQNVNPSEILTFAAMESSLNPSAASKGDSSAKGLYGFTNATWNYQLSKSGSNLPLSNNPSPLNVDDATLMATEYFKSNKKILSSVKKDVNVTDIYLAHFLGPTGARRILSADPSALAKDILPEAAAKNPAYFYSGGRPLTVGEMYKNIDEKLSKKAKEFGINLRTGNTLKPNSVNDDSRLAQTPISSSSSVSSSIPSVMPEAPSSSTNSSSTPQSMRSRVAPVAPMSIIDSVSSSSSGRSQDAGDISKSFESIGATLNKSYEVQEKMLSALERIVQNTEVLQSLKGNQSSNSAPTNTAKPEEPRRITSSIDLRRTAT